MPETVAPLALSIGDPAGLGPELAVLAWHVRKSENLPAFYVLHGADVLRAAADRMGMALPLASITAADEVAGAFPNA